MKGEVRLWDKTEWMSTYVLWFHTRTVPTSCVKGNRDTDQNE